MLTKNIFNPFTQERNRNFLEVVCAWINEILNSIMGLNELLKKTKISSRGLLYLSEKYIQNTALNYVQKRKKRTKKDLANKLLKVPILINAHTKS